MLIKQPQSHSHANKASLDRLGVNGNNNLMIDGVEKLGGTVTTAPNPNVVRPTVTKIDAYFEGSNTSAFFMPMLVLDCSGIVGFASGGTFTFTFTPDFVSSPTQINSVDDWYHFHSDDGLTGGTVVSNSNPAGNMVSGTRVTFTRTMNPTAGKPYLGIVPKFIPVGGVTGGSYKLSMLDIVVTFSGTVIPSNLLVNAGGHAAFNPTMPVTKITKVQNYTPNKLQTRWEGRTYCAYGDSITDYSNGAPATFNAYPYLVSQILGTFHLTDKAESGQSTAVTPVDGNNLLKLVNQYQGYDLITIALGVNDYNFNVPLGTLGVKTDLASSFNKSTYYGALRFALDTIYKANPYVTIVLLTPITKTNDNANTVGLTLDAYRDAMVAVGKMYNTPVCRMEMCLNSVNMTIFSQDGLHINDDGHKKFADYLSAFLATI